MTPQQAKQLVGHMVMMKKSTRGRFRRPSPCLLVAVVGDDHAEVRPGKRHRQTEIVKLDNLREWKAGNPCQT
jgi:hypothetical protein